MSYGSGWVCGVVVWARFFDCCTSLWATYWDLNKIVDICKRNFQMHVLHWKLSCSDLKFTSFYPIENGVVLARYWLYVVSDSGNVWRQIGAKPLSEPMMIRIRCTMWCHKARMRRWYICLYLFWIWEYSVHLIDIHYDDVIMTTLASQITSLAVVYSIVYSGVDQIKHQSFASLAFVREFTGAGEFPAQRASNAENVSIWRRHHGLWLIRQNIWHICVSESGQHWFR